MGNFCVMIVSWYVGYFDVEVECVEVDCRILFVGFDIGEIDIVILMGVVSYNGF